MSILTISKEDILLNNIKIKNKPIVVSIEAKLSFNKTVLQNYIGLNEYNLDYSNSYLINKNGSKKQLNWYLFKEEGIVIKCINNYIIIEDIVNNNSKIFKLINSPIKNLYFNLKKFYNDNLSWRCRFLFWYYIYKYYSYYNYFREI